LIKKLVLLKALKIAALMLVVTIAGTMTYSYLTVKNLERKMQLEPREAKEVEKVTIEPKKEDPWYILLVGIDRRPERKVGRADTIMLLRVDPNSKTAHLLSIPRDSRVNIPGHGLDKINHSFAYGGAPLLISTVESYTGLDMNYYFQVDFEMFKEMVDAIGGVDFEVDQSWRGSNIRHGFHRRDGEEALLLLSLRNYPDGDFTRIKHQQQFLSAAMKQMAGSYIKGPELASIVAVHSKTNMDIGKMVSLGKAFVPSGANLQMATLPGKMGSLNGISYVFPDEKAKNELVEVMKKGEDFPSN